MTKLGEVFAVPVRVAKSHDRQDCDVWSIIGANNIWIADVIDQQEAIALAEAINTHDRMREVLEQISNGCFIGASSFAISDIAGYKELNRTARSALAREGEKE